MRTHTIAAGHSVDYAFDPRGIAETGPPIEKLGKEFRIRLELGSIFFAVATLAVDVSCT